MKYEYEYENRTFPHQHLSWSESQWGTQCGARMDPGCEARPSQGTIHTRVSNHSHVRTI